MTQIERRKEWGVKVASFKPVAKVYRHGVKNTMSNLTGYGIGFESLNLKRLLS